MPANDPGGQAPAPARVPRWTTLDQLRRNPELVRRLLAALRTSDGPARRTTRHFQSGL